MQKIIDKTKKNSRYIEIIRFGIVGGTGTLVDFTTFNISIIVFSLSVFWATVISFIFSITNNFILNKIWTFKSKSPTTGHMLKEMAKFFSMGLVTFGLNLALMMFFSNYTVLGQSIMGLNIAKIICIVIISICNYVGSRFWVFRKS